MPLLLSLVAVLVVLLAPSAAHAGDLRCTGDPAQVERLDLAVGGQPAYGFFVAPAAAPQTLVVFGHGYSHTADGWRDHMRRQTQRLGVLSIAMNYRGTRDLPPAADGYARSRGWAVKAGGEDLVAAAQTALARCPSVRTVVLYGVSMGANATGLALASRPKRPDGRPLFDWWIAVEGVHNLTELYQGARLLAGADAFARSAEEDIRAETGGTPETAPGAYAERTNTVRAADIAASGIKGAILVHGIEDGLAPYTFSQEITRALRAGRVPTDLYTVGSKRPTDDANDTTILGHAKVRTGLAGHGSEVSTRHIVIDTGFDRLAALVGRGEPPPCDRDFRVEGRDDTVAPDPSRPAPGCPAGPAVGPSGQRASAPPPALCSPRRARLTRVRARRAGRGLRVSGRARPSTCAGAGALRVEVAVARRTALGRCRFVRRNGRLGGPTSCARPRYLRARGGRTFGLRLARAPRGRLEIRVRAVDRRGPSGAARRRVRPR